MALIKWTKGRKRALGWLSAGALVIAGIGFVGSYTAVRRLAEEKGFGSFAVVFPIGIDCGILVLLGLDLALTWVNLRFAPLRYIAWILTGATVAFNAAVSWPDYLGAAMHSVIPLLFIAVRMSRVASGSAFDRLRGRAVRAGQRARWNEYQGLLVAA